MLSYGLKWFYHHIHWNVGKVSDLALVLIVRTSSLVDIKFTPPSPQPHLITQNYVISYVGGSANEVVEEEKKRRVRGVGEEEEEEEEEEEGGFAKNLFILLW